MVPFERHLRLVLLFDWEKYCFAACQTLAGVEVGQVWRVEDENTARSKHGDRATRAGRAACAGRAR